MRNTYLKLSEKLARSYDLVTLDGYNELTGRGFVDIETPTDSDVGLFGTRLARVTHDLIVFDDKAIEGELEFYPDEDMQSFKSSLRAIAATIKAEKGWKT